MAKERAVKREELEKKLDEMENEKKANDGAILQMKDHKE